MFKKLALSVLVILGMIAMPNELFAQSTKTYQGTMQVVMGTTNSSIIHTTDATPNGSYVNLYIAPFKVGSMPGTITVDAQNVIPDGVARTYLNCVTLKIGSMTMTFSAKVAVSTYNSTSLVYTLNVLEAEWNDEDFIATVNFSGTAL